MLSTRTSLIRNQAAIGLVIFGAGVLLAWECGQEIVAGNVRALEFAALGVAACGAAVIILRNWRAGFYSFLIWMLAEDFVRKYMGNGTLLFFGKDILLGLVYVALYLEIRRGKEKWFRAPFLLFLSLFFWLAVLQMFNEYSPNILYGLLGLKLYFYYVPLIYVGYALMRSDQDVKQFLNLNIIAAVAISAIGIIQAVRGNSFLNPAQLSPELQNLGNLEKVTPISGELFNLPDSVFVSASRFDMYLIIAFVISMGAAGYMLLRSRRRWMAGFVAIGTVVAATMLCGNRSALLLVLGSALVLSSGFLWGAPWRWGQGHRLLKAIRNSVIVGALALAAVILCFPQKAGSRIAFYSETLLPSSSAYELSNRTWNYPLQNLLDVFGGHWIVGSGTGTASLGAQYVSGILGQPQPNDWVEEGFGALIAEMGILAPLLWLLWGGAVLYYSWRIVRRLRGTRFFPLAIAIVWYAFLLLLPMTWSSLSGYQDFICNIYMWLTIGILFRLPEIAANPLATAEPPAKRTSGFQRFRRAMHVN